MVETHPILWSNSFIYGVNIPIFMIKLFEIGFKRTKFYNQTLLFVF
jgi:hypothetical protein